MSKHAFILCIVLFASAANALLGFGEETVDSKVTSAVKKVNDAKKEVDDILLKIQSGEPITAGAPKKSFTLIVNRGSDCYEYLKKRINAKNAIVDECKQIQSQLAKDIADKVKKSVDEAVLKLEEYRASGLECDKITGLFKRTKTFWCNKNIKLAVGGYTFVTKASLLTSKYEIQQLLDNYISDVGKCVANKEQPSSIAEWRQACGGWGIKKSFERKWSGGFSWKL